MYRFEATEKGKMCERKNFEINKSDKLLNYNGTKLCLIIYVSLCMCVRVFVNDYRAASLIIDIVVFSMRCNCESAANIISENN